MKRHRGCRISGSFGDGEIPLPLLFFYLFDEVEAGFITYLLALTRLARGSRSKTLSGGEFGWGGTSTKLQRRCPKVDSERTEISRRLKGEKSA